MALKFRRNVIVPDGTPWGKSMFVYISPVLTRGLTAELPKPAGIGIVFKVGTDGGLVVKSMADDGPAKLSGQIKLEDCLMAVDGRKVFGQSITQVPALLAPIPRAAAPPSPRHPRAHGPWTPPSPSALSTRPAALLLARRHPARARRAATATPRRAPAPAPGVHPGHCARSLGGGGGCGGG